MDFEKTAQTLLFLGLLINEDKMKATPRIHFPEIYSEINMLPPTPGLNFYPKMYSENKFTSPKMYSKRCKRAKAFSTLLQIFSSSAPETSDRSRGRGSSEKTENIEQFDVVHTILTILTSARD